MIITAILAWLHITSAIMWLGGGIFFAFVIGPAIGTLSPPGPGEFFVKVVPRISLFFRIVAGSTVLFGLLLFLVGSRLGSFPAFSLSNAWGISITIGLTFGIIAFLNSEFIAQPPIKKAIQLFRNMQNPESKGPSPELPNTLKNVALTGRITVVLLLAAMTFMVGAGFY